MPARTNRTDPLYRNLLDADCPEDVIERVLTLQQEGGTQALVDLLTAHRKTLLDRIHTGQHALDCLDYLVFTIKKTSERHGT